MTKSTTPSRELTDLRERRVELRIAIAILEERGAEASEIESHRAVLMTINSQIGALERVRAVAPCATLT